MESKDFDPRMFPPGEFGELDKDMLQKHMQDYYMTRCNLKKDDPNLQLACRLIGEAADLFNEILYAHIPLGKRPEILRGKVANTYNENFMRTFYGYLKFLPSLAKPVTEGLRMDGINSIVDNDGYRRNEYADSLAKLLMAMRDGYYLLSANDEECPDRRSKFPSSKIVIQGEYSFSVSSDDLNLSSFSEEYATTEIYPQPFKNLKKVVGNLLTKPESKKDRARLYGYLRELFYYHISDPDFTRHKMPFVDMSEVLELIKELASSESETKFGKPDHSADYIIKIIMIRDYRRQLTRLILRNRQIEPSDIDQLRQRHQSMVKSVLHSDSDSLADDLLRGFCFNEDGPDNSNRVFDDPNEPPITSVIKTTAYFVKILRSLKMISEILYRYTFR